MREERAHAAGSAARLLLPHADALRVGGGLPRGRGGRAARRACCCRRCSRACAARTSRARRPGRVRRQLARTWPSASSATTGATPRSCTRRSTSSTSSALDAGAGRALPRVRARGAVQAGRSRRGGVRAAGQAAAGRGRRPRARGGARAGCGPRRTSSSARSPRAERDRLFAGARALLFPGEEDFGIVPVEAQAAGVPVIAYGVGGAAETVLDGRTGVLFERAERGLAGARRSSASRGSQLDPPTRARTRGASGASASARRWPRVIERATREPRGMMARVVQEVLPGLHWRAAPADPREVSSYWLDRERAVRPAGAASEGLEWFAARGPMAPTRSCSPTATTTATRRCFVERFGCAVHCNRAGLHEFADGHAVAGFDVGEVLPGGVIACELGAICPDDTALLPAAQRALVIADGSCAEALRQPGALGFVPDALMDDPPATRRGLLARARGCSRSSTSSTCCLPTAARVIGDGLASACTEPTSTARGRTACENAGDARSRHRRQRLHRRRALRARCSSDGHEVIALVRRPGSEPAGTRAAARRPRRRPAPGRALARRRSRTASSTSPPRSPPSASERKVLRGQRRGHASGCSRPACALAGGDPARGRRGSCSPRRSSPATRTARCSARIEPLPVTTPYGRSKQEGERLIARLGPAGGGDPPVPRLRARRLVRGGARSRACASRAASR